MTILAQSIIRREKEVLTCNLETSDRLWWGLGACVKVDMLPLSVLEKPQDSTIVGLVSVFYFTSLRINCRVTEWCRGHEKQGGRRLMLCCTLRGEMV